MTGCILASHDEPVDADVGLLCAPHYARLRSQLLALPAVAGWLHLNIAAGGNAGERVSGSRDDPIPLRQDILDLIGVDSQLPAVRSSIADQAGAEAVRAILAFHAKAVHVDGHVPYPPLATVRFDGQVIGEYASRQAADEDCRYERWLRRRYDNPRRWQVGVVAAREGWADASTVRQLVDFLASHLAWIAGQNWVDALFDDVREATAHAHHLVPWRAETRRDPHPCARCKRPAVVLHIAAGESRCEKKAGGCGRREPLSDYELNVLLPKSRRSA